MVRERTRSEEKIEGRELKTYPRQSAPPSQIAAVEPAIGFKETMRLVLIKWLKHFGLLD